MRWAVFALLVFIIVINTLALHVTAEPITQKFEYLTRLSKQLFDKLRSFRKIGVPLLYEESELSRVKTVLASAYKDIVAGDQLAARVKVEYAGKLINKVQESLRQRFVYSRISFHIMVFFMAITLFLASYMFRLNQINRLVYVLSSYLAIVILLVHAYPAFRIILKTVDYQISLSPLLIVAAFSALFKILFSNSSLERLTSTVSAIVVLACRNIRKHRVTAIRTALVIFILAYTSLTFSSIEYYIGLVNAQLGPAEYEGFMVRRTHIEPFYEPLNAETVAWLTSMKEVAGFSVKAESLPKHYYEAIYERTLELEEIPPPPVLVVSNGKKTYAYGIIGIDYDKESDFTCLDRALITGFLPRSWDLNLVAITYDIAKELNVTVGDAITVLTEKGAKKLVISGILHPATLGLVKDLDGDPITPYLLQLEAGSSIQEYVPLAIMRGNGNRTVIVNVKTALELGCIIARVSFKLKRGVNPFKLAKLITEQLGLQSWFVHSNKTYTFKWSIIKSYKGFNELSILTVMIALTTTDIVAAALYPRRKEAEIIALLGGTPTDIFLVFAVETIVTMLIATAAAILAAYSSVAWLSRIIGLAVSDKLNPLWITLCVTMPFIAAVPPIAFTAFYAAKNVTPLIPTRWSPRPETPGNISIPVMVKWVKLRDFLEYLEARLAEISSSKPLAILSDYKLNISDFTVKYLGQKAICSFRIHLNRSASPILGKVVIECRKKGGRCIFHASVRYDSLSGVSPQIATRIIGFYIRRAALNYKVNGRKIAGNVF